MANLDGLDVTPRTSGGVKERWPQIGGADASTCDPISAFLLDTLRAKSAIHSRNGMAFITLRCWRKTIKGTQISALKALKLSPPPPLVDAAAKEMADAATKVFGGAFRCVVPVPAGSSGMTMSLSILLGNRVASLLRIEVINPIRFDAERGSSTPRKAGQLKPFQLIASIPPGPILLIDDVATSGRHLELAHKVLAATGAAVVSMAWIGS